MWRIVGASVIGTSHTRAGTSCQDANLGRVMADEIALGAVADGLGSASLAHLGAQLAVATILDALTDELGAGLPPKRAQLAQSLVSAMTRAFVAARTALEQYAADRSVPLRELGTTLMAAVCGPDWLVTGHIGDGVIIGYWDGDKLRTASKPERGEYANVTMPLTMDGALEHVRYGYYPDTLHSVVLMSDGLQSLALNTRDNTPFEGFLRPLIETVDRIADDDKATQALVEFLESERVNARTDDDKTLLVISRGAPARPVTEDVTAAIPQAAPPVPAPPMLPPPVKLPPWSAPAVQQPTPEKSVAVERTPAVLRAEQLEREASALQERARVLDEQATQLFAADPGQFNIMKKVRRSAQAKREEADRKRQEAGRLRAGEL